MIHMKVKRINWYVVDHYTGDLEFLLVVFIDILMSKYLLILAVNYCYTFYASRFHGKQLFMHKPGCSGLSILREVTLYARLLAYIKAYNKYYKNFFNAYNGRLHLLYSVLISRQPEVITQFRGLR